MKKEILLLFCIFFLGTLSSAQSTFVKTLGGTGDDAANSAIRTQDGNYLVIGSTTSFGSGGADGYVSKINASAKEIWDKTLGTSGDDFIERGIQLLNGDFLLVGSTTGAGQGSSDVWLVRLDRFGNIIWSRTYGGGRSDIGYSVMETSDGKFVLAGETESDSGMDKDILLVKVEQDGSEIWSKSYGGSEDEGFYGEGLIEDASGNYVVSSEWSNSGNIADKEGLLLSVNPLGDIVRIKKYDIGAIDKSGDFGGYLIETGTGFQNFGSIWDHAVMEQEIWMSDLTMDGVINWSNSFKLPSAILTINAVGRMSSGHYIVAGHYRLDIPNDERYAFLFEVSEIGDIVWSKSYGGAGDSELHYVTQTDNGFLAFGHTDTEGAGASDIFVVRTDEFGTISGCSSEISLVTSSIAPIENIPAPQIETLSMGELQNFNTSNINFEELVVCDGCSADDLAAGLLCENAPIICSIDCLDGFTSTLPDEYILPQPEPLCGGNGFPNNVSWFAFVAGSNTVDLSIIPTNCTTIYNEDGTIAQTIGIQAGIYEDCSFQNSIVCQTDGCMDLVAETLNLASDQFLEGETYYLFVDGCGGSVCDYEVVVNSAQQAFEMDEITTISNNLNIDLDQDSICLGTTITFNLDNFDQMVNFNWSIDPPTSEFPSGIHSVIDTPTVTFNFDQEGCFDIHVYAYNECDNSETRTFSVCVEPLEDEVFSDIYVCQECFPITLVSPESGCIITEGGGAPTVLIEDPNGDGVPGWLGTSTINGPGLDSNLVTNNFGCTYMQYVNVVEISLSPREQVDYYYCLTDFPVDINGTIFNDPGDTRNITIEGGAASGCDSLMSITAHAIDFFGTSSIGNCEAGEVELAMIVNNVPLNAYDSITYIWYDEDGNVVMDSDGVDSILTVSNVGSYSVQVGVTIDGVTCPQSFGPYMIDIDNLAPTIPNVTYAPIEVCVSELQTLIYVANQNLGENYIWTFTPDMPYTLGLTSDTVYVDVTNGEDFEFCVHAVNGCGSTLDICDDVEVIESPDSEFSVDTEICVDSLAIIEYTGTSGVSSSSIFYWDFAGGVIMNGMDPSGGGPFEIEFPNSGQYAISLMISESGCNSIETEYLIDVVEPFSPPMIMCESGIGSVTFSWDETGVDDVDISIQTGQTSFDFVNNTFTVFGLNSEEEVIIQLIFNQNETCAAASFTENCTSLPCPDVELELTLSNQDICIESGQNIMLDAIIMGDNSGMGDWEGQFIGNNVFDITQAGVGEHLVTFIYQLGDCTFTRDTVISIHSSPELDADINLAFCEEMGSNMINIITSSDNIVLLDDEMLSSFEDVEVEVGMHMLEVTSPEGCSSYLDFEIENLGVEDLLISGISSIVKGESADYTASYNSGLEDLILIWTLNSDTICVNCSEVNITPDENGELCVSILYGNGCRVTDCLSIEVNEKTKIFIPNAFSPNNDNVNDFFAINSNNSSVFIEEIMIFDRWGEMVYNRRGFELGEESYYWDGTKNGDFCLEGVYVYVISYLDELNQRKKITGDLTLVR